MNNKYFFFGLLVIFIVGLLAYKVPPFIKGDRCLDAGGVWNKEKGLCEKDEQNTSENKEPLVGADRDSRGCIPSAGMQWSIVKNSCVQPFTSGVSLIPEEKMSSGATFAAYLLESATTTQTLSPGKVIDSFPIEVEVYLPGAVSSVLLKREGTEGSYMWKNETLSAEMMKNGWVIRNSEGNIIFRQ